MWQQSGCRSCTPEHWTRKKSFSHLLVHATMQNRRRRQYQQSQPLAPDQAFCAVKSWSRHALLLVPLGSATSESRPTGNQLPPRRRRRSVSRDSLRAARQSLRKGDISFVSCEIALRNDLRTMHDVCMTNCTAHPQCWRDGSTVYVVDLKYFKHKPSNFHFPSY